MTLHVTRTTLGPLSTSKGLCFFLSACAAITGALSPFTAHGQDADSTGPIVRSVMIRGNDVTKPNVILREMDLRPGSLVTPERQARDRERIYNLQIFNRVDVDVHDLGDSADIYVTVDERWYFYPYPVFGIRNRDANKLIYGAGITHQNVAGLNQKLYFELMTGYDQLGLLRYRNPRFLGSEDFYFEGYANYAHLHPLSNDGGEYQQIQSVLKISLGKRFGFYQTLVATLGTEYWKAPNGTVQRIASASGSDRFITAMLWFTDDRRNLYEYPTAGSFFSLWIAKDGFGESAVNLTRLGLDVRRYTLVSEDWTLAGRIYARLTTGGIVPSYRHVFFGYEERIRGSFTTVREGEHNFGGNVELRIPFLSPRYYESSFIPLKQFSILRYGLYGAVFVDGGKVLYRNRSFVSAPLHSGAGVGLHWILPYGLALRTELAFKPGGKADYIIDFGASF